MAHESGREDFDIDCLRHIVADAEVRRVSLSAAMIKLHALAIARTEPALRSDALEIVRHSEQLYARLPRREAIARIVAGHLGALRTLRPEALVDEIWEHLRLGHDAPGSGGQPETGPGGGLA